MLIINICNFCVKEYPKISIITPNYNQCKYLEFTIKSVLDQGYPNLEYIIMDGGSTDDSIRIIKRYESDLAFWHSSRDNGMYDAINKGLARATGEIMGWINSDDILWEGSLHYIAEVFSGNNKINWLQGFPSVINEEGKVVYQRSPIFSKFYFYLAMHEKSHEFIQQESTFWSRRLWVDSGSNLNLDYSLAADFDLWLRFFELDTLYCSNKQLAAFRKRSGQRSSDTNLYLKEARTSILKNRYLLSFFDKAKLTIANFLFRNHYATKTMKSRISSGVIGKPTYID